MLVEIHVIQNHAPANLNRDEQGNPKTAIFGGMQRARISSQCLKRSIRKSDVFKDVLANQNLGIRSRMLPQAVKDGLIAEHVSEAIAAAAERKIKAGFFRKEKIEKGKKSKGKAEDAEEDDVDAEEEVIEDSTAEKAVKETQMIYYSPTEVAAIVAAMKNIASKCGGDVAKFNNVPASEMSEAAGKIEHSVSPDISLFGRMVTDPYKLAPPATPSVESALQVAHAISTHQVEAEYDFFTAVDDVVEEDTDETKAGHLSDVAFNGSCYYKYASIDVDKLARNLGSAENVPKVIQAFIEGFIRAMPTGKQNTFAAHQLPDAILIEVRPKKTPVSYANAFAVPANRSGKGIVWNSINKLAAHASEITRRYSLEAAKRLWFVTDAGAGITVEGTTQYEDVKSLLGGLTNGLPPAQA